MFAKGIRVERAFRQRGVVGVIGCARGAMEEKEEVGFERTAACKTPKVQLALYPSRGEGK